MLLTLFQNFISSNLITVRLLLNVVYLQILFLNINKFIQYPFQTEEIKDRDDNIFYNFLGQVSCQQTSRIQT